MSEENYGKTPTEYIPQRIKAGVEFMAPFCRKATRNANRYLDPSSRRISALSGFEDGKPESLPVGEINDLAMNIRQKVAACTIANPDWVVECSEPEAAPLVKEFIRKWWKSRKWGRVFRRALSSRFITGLGMVAYMWDAEEGFVVEYVRPDDFVIDPHVTDEGWDNPRWAARKVKVPCDEAYEKWGREIFGTEDHATGINEEKKSVDIWIYYDREYEVEIYNDKVLGQVRPNLYGRIPMRVVSGDPNPDGEFPLGDYDTGLGVFEMLRKQRNVLNGIAQHGGSKWWIRSDFIDPKTKESVMDGTHQGPIPVSGIPGEQAMGYVQPEPINEATLRTIQMMEDGLRADQGVLDLDMGVVQEGADETATQTAIRSSRSSARSNLLRSECETFVEDVVNDMVRITVLFGLDPRQDPQEDDIVIWEALSTVLEVRIVEESMMFRDPAMRQQQSMQLFNLATQNFELMNMLGVAPNLKRLWDDVLRSFDRRDVDLYYLSTPGIMAGQMQEGEQEEEF